jgi:hypothetical protein
MIGERSGSPGPFFCRFNLEDVVLSDHLLRKIDTVRDLSRLRSELASHYKPRRTPLDRSGADDTDGSNRLWLPFGAPSVRGSPSEACLSLVLSCRPGRLH